MRFGLPGVVLGALLAGPAAAQTADLPPWIHPDPANKVVLLDLVVTRPTGAASAQISGEHDGGIQVIVPRGWTTAWWSWPNAKSSLRRAARRCLPTP
jgi:hypothetical protein